MVIALGLLPELHYPVTPPRTERRWGRISGGAHRQRGIHPHPKRLVNGDAKHASRGEKSSHGMDELGPGHDNHLVVSM